MAKINAPPAAWAPGQKTAEVLIACCPECGSTLVYYRGRAASPRSVLYWRCDLGHTWKSLDMRLVRATRILTVKQ